MADRAPFFFTRTAIAQAFELAAPEGHFDVDAVSPLQAAAAIASPVLLIHGAADTATPPAHSRRLFDALRGPKRLILVRGAAHNESLRGEIWRDVERWIDGAVPATVRIGPR